MRRYYIGIDAGTESFRAGVFDDRGTRLGFGVAPNRTLFPQPGWAEQDPREWNGSLVSCIREAIAASGVPAASIESIGFAATTCTVVLLDRDGNPVCDALLWMDIRASEEAREVAETNDPALKYVGFRSVSPEWFPCKALWIRRNRPREYSAAATIFEQTDWLAWRLSGELTVNINTLSTRWFYDARKGGYPASLYEAIGLTDVFAKVPHRVVKIGEVVGGLTREMSELTGLRSGIPVAGGGADAFTGAIGVNALAPGRLALITGSSQLQLALTDREVHAKGLFGSFPDAIVDGLELVEGGQISTGSVMNWFTLNLLPASITAEAQSRSCPVYEILEEHAATIGAGSDGLIVLEHWQGNRTPWTDSSSRGVIRGLTLSHTPFHLYRAIMEGVSYGTRIIFELMEKSGIRIEQTIACGGATMSELWMQITADVTGKPITVPREHHAVSLGSAIAAAVASGAFDHLTAAADSMVKTARSFEPDPRATRLYDELIRHYVSTYVSLRGDSAELVGFTETQRRAVLERSNDRPVEQTDDRGQDHH